MPALTLARGSPTGADDCAATPSAAVGAPGRRRRSKVDAYLGKTIDGRYLVERVLGEGGMGIVYAGRHKVIDKRVAIKVLRGEMATDHELTERFLQEARAASAIGNPHIVDISDFGQLPDGSTYFVMEFLDGKSLSAVMTETRRGRCRCRASATSPSRSRRGSSAAHAANIVHRDLKPDNVMLIDRGSEKDFVKILDFGIAKVGSGTKRMTRAGSVFGTPHYMSPEQAAGAAVDHRTDIYALGVILYEMASGKVPFDADNFMGILTQHMYKAPVPIRALVPEVDVPPGLDAIVLKCLTKKPEGRYQTMDELVADLEKLEQGVLPDAVQEMMARSGGFNVPADYFRSSAMPAPVPASPPERAKRWPLFAVIGAVGDRPRGRRRGARGEEPEQHGRRRCRAAVGARRSPAAAPTVAPAGAGRARRAGSGAGPVPRGARERARPGDATITRDGKDLGAAPRRAAPRRRRDGELVVARKGYKPKTVIIDGSDSKMSFSLDRPTRLRRRTRPSPPGRLEVGGIDDVGDPFAKH